MIRKLRSPALFQFVKYSLSGIFLTLLYSVVYLSLTFIGMNPIHAHFIAYAISIIVGFLVNHYWSFADPTRKGRMFASGARFAIVSLVGLGLNTAFVWVLTGPWVGGAVWWPLIPIATLTPVVTFVLNKVWTFSHGSHSLRSDGTA